MKAMKITGLFVEFPMERNVSRPHGIDLFPYTPTAIG